MSWSISGCRATPCRPGASRSTSTTPSTSFTVTSSSRSSTPTMTSAAFCPFTSTTRPRAGLEVRAHLRRLVRRIRQRWPKTRILIRGDGHYGRPEVLDWCEDNGVDYVFGLPGNRVLARLVDEPADDIRTRRALGRMPALRGFAETRYQAKSWRAERRACARIEATTLGLDVRF